MPSANTIEDLRGFLRLFANSEVAASYVLAVVYNIGSYYGRDQGEIVLVRERNGEDLTMEEFMADSNITEQALVKLQKDSSTELTVEESESICLDLVDHLLSDDKDLADAVRTQIARALPKVSKEVKDKIAHKLTIYDL